MTVPQDMMNDIRSMDAGGVPRAEIARRLCVSCNTVAKYADMEDMSPAAPTPAPRSRPALAGHEVWVEPVLESNLGGPHKQRHTAKGVYDRLVVKRSHERSCSTVRHCVRRLAPLPRVGRRRGLPRARVGAGHLPGRLRQLPHRGRRRGTRPEAPRPHACQR